MKIKCKYTISLSCGKCDKEETYEAESSDIAKDLVNEGGWIKIYILSSKIDAYSEDWSHCITEKTYYLCNSCKQETLNYDW